MTDYRVRDGKKRREWANAIEDLPFRPGCTGYCYGPSPDETVMQLKHFTLADWDRVYGTVLEAGNVTLCSVYIADADREDKGYDYPHTAVSREHLDRVVAAHGHEILDILVMPPLVGPKEPLVLTQRVNRHIDTFMADDTESEFRL